MLTYFGSLPKDLRTELQYYQNYTLVCKVNEYLKNYPLSCYYYSYYAEKYVADSVRNAIISSDFEKEIIVIQESAINHYDVYVKLIQTHLFTPLKLIKIGNNICNASSLFIRPDIPIQNFNKILRETGYTEQISLP